MTDPTVTPGVSRARAVLEFEKALQTLVLTDARDLHPKVRVRVLLLVAVALDDASALDAAWSPEQFLEVARGMVEQYVAGSAEVERRTV